jgi:Putative adhesin
MLDRMSPSAGFGRERTEAQFERVLNVTGAVRLDVSVRAGVIRVRRGDDGSVMIRGTFRAHASIFSWRHPEDKVELLAADPPVEQNGNTIQVGDGSDRWLLRGVHLLVDITTPADTRLRALGDSADVRVEGINGPVDCETDSGEIQIASIVSDVSASSDSGAIHIQDAAGSVDVRTDSGEIEAIQIGGGIDARTDSGNMRLSQIAAHPVYAQSDSGSISMKLADGGGYTIRVRTDHGRVEMPQMSRASLSKREMGGEVGGGGSVVAIETDSGDIDIV